MPIKIVSDSSSNVFNIKDVQYSSVPLKIVTKEKEYSDTEELDIYNMIEELGIYKGTSGSSCPNVSEWLDGFGKSNDIFGVSISSNISGSYSAAIRAEKEYKEQNPNSNIYIIDTLTAGPEMKLIIEKLREMILSKNTFKNIKNHIIEYQKHTHTIFMLESLMNFAKNGRVNPAVAKLAGILGIRIIGRASDKGTLQLTHKSRGEKNALNTIFEDMKKEGFKGGKVRIDHCMNEETALNLKEKILSEFPDSDIEIGICHGLCSYYAEKKGVLIGFEDTNA